ncbi:hypothetical protein [Paenibacillus arenilitoris]|uniref:Uncharacterized protein n=1 Tax=Paenibacillus arenilitoris TaxID=2772299 RepID=A0A927CM65_9BACL|nr:hypothetical protein [Paenibacillus arenilitoris]MBD2868150.1 hypothetical protein [Paenibacillus arenilitoris]
MNIRRRFILPAVALIAIAAVTLVIWISFRPEQAVRHAAANESVIHSETFAVTAVSGQLDTTAKGTLFVLGGEGEAKQIRIVASIEVDPDDWGGIAFNIPKQWYVSNILSSYPDSKAQSDSDDYVSTWMTADTDVEWHARVEVGRDRSYKPAEGGTGTVVIDLVHDQEAETLQETFKMVVEVGSKDKNGIKVMGTDFVEIAIPLQRP